METVWIVDSEHWPRAYLRAELIERGFEATGFVNLREALRVLKTASTERPRVMVIDLRAQLFDEHDLDELANTGIPVIAIVGAVELNHPLIGQLRSEMKLKRPVSLGRVAETVARVVSNLQDSQPKPGEFPQRVTERPSTRPRF